MLLGTPTVYSENLAAVIFDDLASNLLSLILAELKFDSVAVQSFEIIETTLPVYTGYDTSQT